MAKTTIGILNVKLNAQTAAFGKGLKKSQKTLFGFKRSTLVGVAAFGAFTAAAIRSGKRLLDLSRETAQYGDDLLNAANKIGIATEELQALRFAGRVTSVEMSKLDGGLLKLQRSIGDSIDGNKEYKDTFDKLGLSVHELAQMTPERQLRAFADALQGVSTDAEKVNAAATLMGRSGADLLPMLANGSKGLDDFRSKFQQTGAAIDNEGAAKLAAANAELEFFSTSAKGAARDVGGSLAPSIGALGRSLRDLATEAFPDIDFGDKLRRGVEGFIGVTLDGIDLIARGVTRIRIIGDRAMASVIEGAAKVHVALQRINPVSDMNQVRAQADVMNDFADSLRSRADRLEAVNEALQRQSLGDRFRANLKKINGESSSFVKMLTQAAGLQREIGRQQEMAGRSGADRFEQVVRSQIAVGGVRGGRSPLVDIGNRQVALLERIAGNAGRAA